MAKKAAKKSEKGPTYDEMLRFYKDSLATGEAFYYAQMMKQGNGEEGRARGHDATLYGLEKVGLEGILKGLRAQAQEQKIQGDNPNYNLNGVVENGRQIFIETIFGKPERAIKIKDLVPYIQERLGKDVEIVEETKYKDMTLADLGKKESSDEEKLYAVYLKEQVDYAVMAKMGAVLPQEEAKRMTEAYKSGNLKIKEAKD